MSKVITHWQPENPEFWQSTGKQIAKRNLWISIPALLLAFAIWQVWSVAVVNLPNIGFKYTENQLFWLAALPALSGATLRIFYSFMVPVFGGRKWTTLSTASLLLPAIGIGYAVQDPNTSYTTMVILALLCGFGGGNFSSSMSNISFFFPKAEKGTAMGLNAGLGNLGVSVVQFVVPLIITAGVFGALGGEAQTWTKGDVTKQMWLQNAGFIWVPFIILSAITAWFGMNDLADAKASFKEQSVIFSRKHNWIMCIIYLGTFGSFLGFAAGFALLTKSQFSGIDPVKYAFVGPLVSAFSSPSWRYVGRQNQKRCESNSAGVHRHDYFRNWRIVFLANQRTRWQLLGLLRLLRSFVYFDRLRQRFNLYANSIDFCERASKNGKSRFRNRRPSTFERKQRKCCSSRFYRCICSLWRFLHSQKLQRIN